MGPWKLVFDEDAFQVLLNGKAAERRHLLTICEALRKDPNQQVDYHTKDATGRNLNVIARRPYLITFWLDAFVSEVRIVNLQRVQY